MATQTNSTTNHRHQLLGWLLPLTALLIIGLLSVKVRASDIVQGFHSNNIKTLGMLVAQSPDNQNEVELANQGNTDQLVGVTGAQADGLLTFTSKTDNIYVVVKGEAEVYVSDLNGSIETGDYVVASPLNGVGMAADDGSNFVVGTALENFDDKTTTQTASVTDKENTTHQVKVTKLKVDVQPGNITQNNTSQRQVFVSFLGEAVAGGPVSQLQIVIALILFFILLIVEGSILYGSIYSSVIAIGRNPLARRAVYKDLAQVSGIAVVVLIVGLGAIYLVLAV